MFNDVSTIESVTGAITRYLKLSKKDNRFSKIFHLCIQYAIKHIGAVDFQKKVSVVYGEKISPELRSSLAQSIYFLRNFRAFIIRVASSADVNISKYLKLYEIPLDDSKSFAPLIPKLQEIDVEKSVVRRVCNLKSLDEKLADIILEVKTHCERVVKGKMYFILSSCNYQVHDLVSEMLCKAVTAFYHTSIECKSRLHTLNGLRQACTNHSLNMIKYFTAKKRSRLNKVGDDSFALMIVSENQLSKTFSTVNAEDEFDLEFDSLNAVDTTPHLMLSISIKQLLKKLEQKIDNGINVKTNTKKIQFIRLLMGNYDEKFSNFLKEQGVKWANDEYQDKVKPHRYIEMITKFLEKPKKWGQEFVLSLRQCLA